MHGRWKFLFLVCVLALPTIGRAQSAENVRQYNSLLQQYERLRPTMSRADQTRLDAAFVELRTSLVSERAVGSPATRSVLSTNPYLPGSTTGAGSKYDPDSPSNPYGEYGSPFSVNGARNKYTTGGADVVGSDGQYLGKLNANPYDPNSISNPYGKYGSPYSPTSVNNPYSQYGSPYSPTSARNPYASDPPKLYAPKTTVGLPALSLPSIGLPPIGLPPIRP